MTQRIQMKITSDPSLLSVLRAAMIQICNLAGFSQIVTGKIILAVDEACTNIIRHAYKGEAGRPIYVICEIDSELLKIMLLDKGFVYACD